MTLRKPEPWSAAVSEVNIGELWVHWEALSLHDTRPNGRAGALREGMLAR